MATPKSNTIKLQRFGLVIYSPLIVPRIKAISRLQDARLQLGPHDLWQTFAKLAHKGYAALEQILNLAWPCVYSNPPKMGSPSTYATVPQGRF